VPFSCLSKVPPEKLLQLVGGFPLQGRDDVGVGVEGQGDRLVAEVLLHDLGVDALLNYVKPICDGLNGAAWHDDRQAEEIHARRVVCPGEPDRAELRVQPKS